MTLADRASLAEIIGGIVVTVSLIFVGIQIRKNTIAAQANTLQNSICQDVEMLMSLGTSKTSGEALYAYTNWPEKLADEERARGGGYLPHQCVIGRISSSSTYREHFLIVHGRRERKL